MFHFYRASAINLSQQIGLFCQQQYLCKKQTKFQIHIYTARRMHGFVQSMYTMINLYMYIYISIDRYTYMNKYSHMVLQPFANLKKEKKLHVCTCIYTYLFIQMYGHV